MPPSTITPKTNIFWDWWVTTVEGTVDEKYGIHIQFLLILYNKYVLMPLLMRKTLDTNHKASAAGFYWNGAPLNYKIKPLLIFLSFLYFNSFFQEEIESDLY